MLADGAEDPAEERVRDRVLLLQERDVALQGRVLEALLVDVGVEVLADVVREAERPTHVGLSGNARKRHNMVACHGDSWHTEEYPKGIPEV